MRVQGGVAIDVIVFKAGILATLLNVFESKATPSNENIFNIPCLTKITSASVRKIHHGVSDMLLIYVISGT